jgi:hypothetical protein
MTGEGQPDRVGDEDRVPAEGFHDQRQGYSERIDPDPGLGRAEQVLFPLRLDQREGQPLVLLPGVGTGRLARPAQWYPSPPS